MMQTLRASVVTCALLFHTGADASVWQIPSPRLGACTRLDTDIFDNKKFEDWETIYDDLVDKEVEEFIGERLSDPFAQRRTTAAACTSDDPAQFLPAPDTIQSLAMRLEPWRDLGATPEPFTQADIAPVLLELLRVYECAHVERMLFLPMEIISDEHQQRSLLPGGYYANPLAYNNLYRNMQKDVDTTVERIAIARPTLEHILDLLGGLIRLRMLESEFECIERASLDLNAAMALGAEASACLPRVWNAKDPLRDPPECSDGIDNDGDGTIDLDDDSCESPLDTTE